MRDLDDRLDSSAPRLHPGEDELNDALMELVATSRRVSLRARKPRRAVLVGTAAVVLVGGGTAAAATGAGWTAPWAQDDVVATVAWQLPSGGTCEQVVGDLRLEDPDAEAMLQEWFTSNDFADIVDVSSSLQALRNEQHHWVNATGDEVAYGYGTANYDADYEYYTAVHRAEQEAIEEKLAQEGFGEDYVTGWAAETRCSGSNPYPGMWKPGPAE